MKRFRGILGAVLLAFLLSEAAYGYIGPGAGFAVVSSIFFIIGAALLGMATLALWPLRILMANWHRRRLRLRAKVKRIVILGFDGMDPSRCQDYMEAGHLPALSALRERGGFRALGTTLPAISPVAWSTFATGVTAGKHGIFDFFTRDANSYLPCLSSVKITSLRRFLRLGFLKIPCGYRAHVQLMRKSRSLWQILGDHKIFSTILRVPITFPPESFYGVCLSAMCTPDLRGGQGSYTLLTSDADMINKESEGTHVLLSRSCDRFEGSIPGPEIENSSPKRTMSISIKGRINADAEKVLLYLSDQCIELEPGHYSSWIRLHFKDGGRKNARGIVRFMITELAPEIRIYMTPIHIDPEKPIMRISHPYPYAVSLAKRMGFFATLGLSEDTWALNEDIITEEAFLEQTYAILQEREALLMDQIDKNLNGLTVMVFDHTDRIQHMFYRYLDPEHPANIDRDTKTHQDAVETAYRKSDQVVAKVMARMGPDDLLIVMSDHGFQSFRFGVNLNTWLWEKGYLAVKENGKLNAKWLADVDWSHTRAYALGLAGLFINLKGRERHGIVTPGKELAALVLEIKAGLEQLWDHKQQVHPIKTAYQSTEFLRGPYSREAPDLIMGYETGYRASWNCVVGRVSDLVIEPNDRRWSGDHCVDPSKVPGVWFSNWRIRSRNPGIADVAPTILDLFGIRPPHFQEGRIMDLSPPLQPRDAVQEQVNYES